MILGVNPKVASVHLQFASTICWPGAIPAAISLHDEAGPSHEPWGYLGVMGVLGMGVTLRRLEHHFPHDKLTMADPTF